MSSYRILSWQTKAKYSSTAIPALDRIHPFRSKSLLGIMSFSINSFVLFAICSQFFWSCYCQTYLKANGDTDSTYDLIAKVLGGGKEAVETPDCAHPSFPHHISQVQDDDLNRPVFAFYIHVTPDNDRCEKTDRYK